YRHELAELGVVGSLGWIAWTALFLWSLVRARARESRLWTAAALRAVLAGFGLISLLGVPAQEVSVALAFWTLAFWYTLTVDRAPRVGASLDRRASWAVAWILAFV